VLVLQGFCDSAPFDDAGSGQQILLHRCSTTRSGSACPQRSQLAGSPAATIKTSALAGESSAIARPSTPIATEVDPCDGKEGLHLLATADIAEAWSTSDATALAWRLHL
jgi:hypothetical protein